MLKYKQLGLGMIALLSVNQSDAGMFLDLDLGAMLQNHEHTSYTAQGEAVISNKYVSDQNPIFVLRAGYETGTYQLFGPVDISAHSYYEHISSAGTRSDTGMDLFMFGVRLE